MPEPLITIDAGIMGYRDMTVFNGLTLSIPKGEVTALCGPNGCGKSTVLKAMRGIQPLSAGEVILDAMPLGQWSAKGLARTVAMLGQTPTAPEEMRVRDLVALGRYAHRKPFAGLDIGDHTAIDTALRATTMVALAETPLANLSGGQAQRAWLAMVLAQQSPVIFLDEPTNHLDISHALSTLSLVRQMARNGGKTVVIVLHDLNMAATVADRIVLFKSGQVAAEGPVKEVLTSQNIETVFDIPCAVMTRPDSNLPLVVPLLGRIGKSEGNTNLSAQKADALE
ncbi:MULTISPECIES: ABC transporter ATP-binding protein [Paracoccaceae]|uniref:ABC transporter ATP-binding protein n=1 Tax=Paracoccaceae TaxID=31989 RepID=UPI001ABA90BD|nr:ABC transporter ATP-binding protein [Pseudaestuariivita rosea]